MSAPARINPLQPAERRANLGQYAGDPNFVLSLARGLKVIESFEGHTEGRSASEIAESTGLSRAAVRRLLLTLEMLGYVESARRVYRLKSRVLNLALSYLSSTSLVTAAQPVLERISEQVGESSSMSLLDGDQIVYVARSAASRVMSVSLSVGSRLPAYCTSMGRVLLAWLPEEELDAYLKALKPKAFTQHTVLHRRRLREAILKVRKQGYALVSEELETGLRALAVPVRTRLNRVAAAINVGAHALRMDSNQMLRKCLPALTEGARTLSNLLM